MVISSSCRSRYGLMSSVVLRAIFVVCVRIAWIVVEASMPRARRERSWPANPVIMPAWVLPVTLHTTMVSKNMPSSASCCVTSYVQLAKPRPPGWWAEAPAGMAYGVPLAGRTSSGAWFRLS